MTENYMHGAYLQNMTSPSHSSDKVLWPLDRERAAFLAQMDRISSARHAMHVAELADDWAEARR